MILIPAVLAAELHFVAIPTVGIDSDDGLGFGARAELTSVQEGVDPYLASFVLQGYATLQGYHHHRFRFDLPNLPDGSRLTGHMAFRAWLHDGYFGMGNSAVRNLDRPEEDYRYSLIQPFARLSWSKPISESWSVFGALEGKWSRVEFAPDSKLAEDLPVGIEGGPGIQLLGGVAFDTRFPEVTPEKGWLVELGIRASPLPLPAGAGAYGGGSVSVRGFKMLLPRLGLAGRGIVEYLAGQIPFYELVQWGGWLPVSGMGGADSIRGIAFGRFRGPGKLVLNSELRVDVVEHSLFSRSMRWQVVPFVDAGAVFGVPEEREPAFPLHPGVGAGIRAIFDTTLVGRLDIAAGWEPVQQGSEQFQKAELGFYLVFDHTF
jgi:hypothetical protein